ncbi:MAG: PAS domain-containing sensor histidine kinase [Chloroflexi bacterium]|nr:PAS domain-containing sensor histidine kinase [Chloroflexota bacterium]
MKSLLGSASDADLPGLAEAESFVKAALDGLTAHIAILDETGTIIHVNHAWRSFADTNGYTDSRYGIGSNYLAVCDRAATPDAIAVAQGIRRVLARSLPQFDLEYPCHSPAERRWFVIQVTAFEWRNYRRVVVAHQNVTEIKSAQVELQNSKQRLETILDNLVDGIITFDRRGLIETINPAGAAIFGYQPSELIGQPIQCLMVELDQQHNERALMNFVEKIGRLGDEITGRRKDGTLFPIYFAVSQLRLDDKRLFTGVIQDFTERKYLEGQLLEKQRLDLALDNERELRDLKNRFLSMMSHELRTPLGAIRLANSMLKTYGDRMTEQEKRESYEVIETQTEHLAEMINDVMTISKSDFTGAEFNPETVDLETYCRDIIEEIQLAYRMTCCIGFSGTGRRVEAEVDVKLLRRAITNLLTNAIKYSPEAAPITVELACDGDEAVIRVSDQGIGIPEDDQRRLFEPFHRASNVGQIQGTGLGLAITRQAIERHGGSISVESQVGAGTTFIVRLPLKPKA